MARAYPRRIVHTAPCQGPECTKALLSPSFGLCHAHNEQRRLKGRLKPLAPRGRWGAPESVLWGGERWYRYPGATNDDARRYFRRGSSLLHRTVWTATHGQIPPNHHIHHRDGCHGNNSIENLECLSPSAHSRGHWLTRTPLSLPRTCEICGRSFAAFEKQRTICSKRCYKRRTEHTRPERWRV
jgi:hypothetical protein